MGSFTSATKLAPFPENATDSFTGFERAQERDFRYNGFPVEIYMCQSNGVDTDYTLPTGFNRVHGGYLLKSGDSEGNASIPGKINATDETKCDFSGLTISSWYLVVVFGEKNLAGFPTA